jgi:hypothetical protein
MYRKEIAAVLKKGICDIRKLDLFTKSIVTVLFIGALLKSAQLPSIPDNESYYVQTIKWINEYGFVKGLGNLHLFLSQASGWHILQAGLNFSFISHRINDINGFVFILCTLYYFTESKKYYNRKETYWLALWPVFSVVLFMFLDAPSPDLPLLAITPIILHLYLQDKNNDTTIATLLFILLAFIKITIAPLGLLFVFAAQNRKRIPTTLAALVTALLWTGKNYIISGHPFYPFTFTSLEAGWAVPKGVLDSLNLSANQHVYYAKASAPIAKKITGWFLAEGITGLCNKFMVVLLLIVPFFKQVRTGSRYRNIYIAFGIQFILLLVTSPQYRFFLPALLFFTSFLGMQAYNSLTLNNSVYKTVLVIATVAVVLTFTNFQPAGISATNELHQKAGGLSLKQLCLPETNTKFGNMTFTLQKTGNLNYYSPAENFFFYGTANGPLPCINEVQVNYLEHKFGIVPQLRTGDIKDGFYSAPVEKKQ